MSHDVRQNQILDDHEARLRAIEHNLGRLLAHVGLVWEAPAALPAWPAEVQERLQQGDKIGAIKALATLRRLGLKEAKDAIERGQP
jgi:ribosomal protein L7/L12